MTRTRVRLLAGGAAIALIGIVAARSSQHAWMTIGAVAVLLLASLGLVSAGSQLRLWWIRRESWRRR